MFSQSTSSLTHIDRVDDTKDLNEFEEPRKPKGLFEKFKGRSHRSRSRDKMRDYYSPTSPVTSESHGTALLPEVKRFPTVDRRFWPLKEVFSPPSILVTFNNEIFTAINIGEISSLESLRTEIGEILRIDLTDYQFQLTDLGHRPGEVLDDAAVKELLNYIRTPPCATVKLYVTPRTLSSTHSAANGRSPAQELASRKYPNTPSYLIDDKERGRPAEDYFDAKYLAPHAGNLQQIEGSRQSQVSQHSTMETLTPSVSNTTVAQTVEPDSQSLQPKPQQTRQNNQRRQQQSDSFKVIRPERREINFDDRRSSPYDRKSSNLVALRSAPPPPNRVPSIKKKDAAVSTNNPRAEVPKTQPSLSVATVDLPGPPVAVSSYSPAASENLIPRPYVGRKNAVLRKPVYGNTGSESSPSPNSAGPSVSTPPTASSVINTSPEDAMQFKVPEYNVSPDKPHHPATDQRFQENEVSFEGAPQYEDNSDDSSDDGLWAKKVSPSRPQRPSPRLEIPRPDLKIDVAPSLSPTSPYKSSSSMGSPILAADAWSVRPSEDIVYENLEKFFPNTDLDKPIIDDSAVLPAFGPLNDSIPSLSPVVEPSESPVGNGFKDAWGINSLKVREDVKERSIHDPVPPGVAAIKRPRTRMKSIRVVAREASEARKNRASQVATHAAGAPNGALLRRKSTKMWGQRVVEMTASEIQRGNLTTIRDQKGNPQKFAWVKGGLIGKGTFGKVYLALNATTGEMMAVKQVEVPQTASDRSSSRQKEVLEALRTEVETMKDLDHLNIVQYLGFEALDDVYNLFLEYVPGGSVGRILKIHGRFQESIIKSLTHQVLDGLSYLHSCKILHRVSFHNCFKNGIIST